MDYQTYRWEGLGRQPAPGGHELKLRLEEEGRGSGLQSWEDEKVPIEHQGLEC